MRRHRWIALVLSGSFLAGCSGGQEPIEQLVEESRLERRRAAREELSRTRQTVPAPAGEAQAPGASPSAPPPEANTTSTSSTSTGPPPTRAATVPRECSQPVDLGPIVLPAPERTFPAVLNGVAIARQPCFERVTFSFKEGFPAAGYKVSYEPGPFQSKANGQRIPIEGRQFLVVRIEPGKGEGDYDLDGQGKIASEPVNPSDARAKIFQARGLAGFGGAVVWVIGVDTRRAFRVGRQTNPPQLTIDV